MKNKSKVIIALILSLSLVFSQMMPAMAEEGDFSDANVSDKVVLETVQDEEQPVVNETESNNTTEDVTESVSDSIQEENDELSVPLKDELIEDGAETIEQEAVVSEDIELEDDSEVSQQESASDEELLTDSEDDDLNVSEETTASEDEESTTSDESEKTEKVSETVAPVKAQTTDKSVQGNKKTPEVTDNNIQSKKSKFGFKAVTLKDGIFEPDKFNVTGGTGKVTIDCPCVKISGETVYAKIVFSSKYYTKMKVAGVQYAGTIDENGSTYYIPAELNKDFSIIATTTAMSVPHDIEYVLNITVTSNSKVVTDNGFPVEPDVDEPTDEPTDEPDAPVYEYKNATYIPDSFDVEGGTGKVTITCPQVKMYHDEAEAVIVFSSEYYTQMKIGDTIYKGIIDKSAGTASYCVPVKINEDYEIIGTTTRMSEPHDIVYTIHIAMTPESEIVPGTEIIDEPEDNPTDDPTKPDKPVKPVKPDKPVNPTPGPGKDDPTKPDKPVNPTPGPGKDDPTKPDKPVKPSKPGTLENGTYELKADTDNRMFYLVPKEDPNAYRATLVKKDGKMTVTITLSGVGYDYLYVGTAAQAAKADKSTWIKYKEKNGYYSYTFDISSLDKELKIAAHSEKYDLWYDHVIIFYSTDAKLVKKGETTVPDKPKKDKTSHGSTPGDKDDKNDGGFINNEDGTGGEQTEFHNDNKKDKESESKGDTEKSTYAVDSSTGLKDGVYTPDKFSWSGGSGRLAYIRCDKITVTDGQAYATIVFSSSSYDQLKANGRIYYNCGGEFSTFVIPVELNTNNKIVGRTVAMSAPHWIEYSIFIYLNEAAKADGGKEIKGDTIKTSKLSEEAPEIAGLETKEETKIDHAENFKIFNYDEGVTLIQIDLKNKSALDYKAVDKSADEKIEYDDEGKPIAKSQGEITNEMYHAKVVNYLVVPEGVEIPAGLDKECIIINAPVKDSQVSSVEVMQFMDQLGIADKIKATGIEEKNIKIDSISKMFKAKDEEDKVFYAGTFDKPDFKEIIKNKININILPAEAIPEKVQKTDEKGNALSKEDIKKQSKAAKKAQTTLETIEKRYSTIGIPVIFDRSTVEKNSVAEAEWIKVYGAIFGCQDEAEKLFEKYVEEHKEDNNEN